MLENLSPCPCEKIAHGALGPIDDCERLARIVCSPQHFRKNGSLKPGLFPKSHFNSGGLSLTRTDKLNQDALEKQGQAIASGITGQKLAGFVTIETKQLRMQMDKSGMQFLCVTDDPTVATGTMPANPAHAIALCSNNQDETEIFELRARLLDLFSELRSAADICK